MEVGTPVELINEVRGTKVGTRGIIKSIEGNVVIVDLQQNNVVLEVGKNDIQAI